MVFDLGLHCSHGPVFISRGHMLTLLILCICKLVLWQTGPVGMVGKQFAKGTADMVSKQFAKGPVCMVGGKQFVKGPVGMVGKHYAK